MKPIEIFKTGTHTAASGVTLEFTEEMVRAAVEAYDPAIHEAPIVVGHPKDNNPAYGWVKSLSFADGIVVANPDQLDADFSEMVQAGRFKKRSASWYLPDAPNNPKPGTLYLRHVGFLGAQPPAVKGLRDVSFSEDEEGVIEFSDTSPYIWQTIGGVLRSLRDWVLAEKGLETADRVIPSYAIRELESETERQIARQTAPLNPMTSFTEGDPMSKELQDQLAAAQAKIVELEGKEASFSEQQKSIAEREAALARKEIDAELDKLVAEGKLLPAQKANVANFMAALDDADAVVDFGEGDAAKKISPRQFMREFLASMPKLVDFEERSGDDKPNPADFSSKELAEKAADYREAMRQKGTHITVTEAVAAVQAGKTA